MNKFNIPIKNIYLMLCYAFNMLDQLNIKKVDTQKFDNIYNLIARLFIQNINILIKKGLYNEYIEITDTLTNIKGKIDIDMSIKKHSFLKKELYCKFDELTPNTKFNQIIKYTINIMLKCNYINSESKILLKRIQKSFYSISELAPTKYICNRLIYNQNNYYYKPIINLCELMFNNIIATEKNGNLVFAEFINDSELARLYERFVLNFYKYHLCKTRYTVSSPKIYWQVSSNNRDNIFLPEMRTDIVLVDNQKGVQFIIDTKFYNQSLNQYIYGNKKTLKSQNLYQIFSYIENSTYKGTKIGVLLYSTVNENLDLKFNIKNNLILIKTLDLATDWDKIENNLLCIPFLLKTFK